ncbi:MAG TPA: DUF6508 domain-containing protein [Acidimicrobiales bacterium]|nr:DUF6508 domain-containing protein [Acidimicrobiales bacterium]
MTPSGSTEPSDAEIELQLRMVNEDRWRALWAAMADIDAEVRPFRWAGGEGQMPYVEYSDAALRLSVCLANVGAVVRFDWMDWGGFQRHPCGEGLAAAPVADAVRMATAVVRGDRFGEGTLANAIADGTLRAIVGRLRRWHDEERGEG